MPKKKAKPPDLNRKWEKNRRDRLKEKFMLLSKALPCYDPSVTLCHEFILENARITIEEQQKELDKILTEKSDNVQDFKDEKIKKLQNKIKKLLFRNEQLSFILKDVGIPLPTYVGSGRFRKSQIKSDNGSEEHFLKKLNKEKENIVTKLVQRKKKGKTPPKKAPASKNFEIKNGNKNKPFIQTPTPSSSCLLMLSQPNAVKSSIPQPCYLLTSNVPDKIAASKSTIPETKTISCLNVNTPLPAFGSGTLLFANGTIMPVLSQPQIIIPTPNPVVAVQKTFPTFATLPKIITNVTLSQPHVTLQSTIVSTAAAPFVPPSNTVLLTPVTSCATMNSVQKKISENLKKFPKVVPKRCLTTTTQVNKVPIPALTSKYANNYILLTESNLVKAQSTPKNPEKERKSNRGGKRKNEEQPKSTGKKGKVEKTGVISATKSNDVVNNVANKVLESTQNENDCPKVDAVAENIQNLKPVDKREITITQQVQHPEPITTQPENAVQATISVPFVQDITSAEEKPSDETINESENTIKTTTTPATTASSTTVVNSNEEMKTLEHLVHSELSNDIFASLQVPPGCQNPDSTSPTAAFLLAFPLVSSVKVSEVMEEENLESQSSTPTLLQIGAIDGVKTTQSDNLLNLDNFTLFSSKNVYGEYYGSFGQSNNEGGKNIENLNSKEESMKPSESGSKTNETVTEKSDQGVENSSKVEHSKNKNVLQDSANIKHRETSGNNCSNVYQQNKNSDAWPSDGYKNQNINFDIPYSKHQNITQQLFLDRKDVKNSITNTQPIVNTDENDTSITCNKNQNLLRISGVSCDNKDTKKSQISLVNTQRPVIPQNHSTTPESWAPKNAQISYEMPSLNTEKKNEPLHKNVEILNECQNESSTPKKPEERIPHWTPNSTKHALETSKTCFDVCSTHNIDRNSKTDDQRNKICNVWDIKERPTETRETSKEIVNNMSNTSNINIQYNIQLNPGSTAGKVPIGQVESTEKHNLNPIRQNKVNISENVFNVQERESQKQLWSMKSTENVKKPTNYHVVENNLTNMWNASQSKANCYKEDNANLLHCDTKNPVTPKEPVKPVQNPGKINSVWSPNNYEGDITKQISNIPTKNQTSYGNVTSQASHNMNNRNQSLVNMTQKDQHQKHDHHHTHQQQQTSHQIQQKQHVHPLVHCNNFNMYQDSLISDNKLPQHSNASLKPTTNFWSSSELSYDKQHSTQYNTFNPSKSNQYDTTRYITQELPKSNNIDKYQNHSWSQDVMGNYQYVSGSSVQETGVTNNNQTNSTNHIQQNADKDILSQNQKQMWQTNFVQDVGSYNLHQGSTNKTTLINTNDKPNVASLWAHNQNQDVLNSYDMQSGVNIQYQPQETLGRPAIESNKNPNVNTINYGMHQRSNNDQKHLWSVNSASFNNHYNLEFEKTKDQQNLTAKNEKKNGNGWNGYSKKVNVNENLKRNSDFSQSSSKANDNNSYGVYQEKNSVVSVSGSDTFANNCIKAKGGVEKQSDHDNFNVFMAGPKDVLQTANNNHDKTNSTTNKATDNSHYHSKDNAINRSNKSNNNSNIKIIEQSQSKQIGEVGEQNQKNLEKNQCYFSTSYPNTTCNFNYKPNYSRNYTNPVYTTSNCTYNYADPTFNQSYYKSPVVKNDAKYYALNYENYQDTTKYYPNTFQADRRNTNVNKNVKTATPQSKPINWMTTPETKLQSTECYLPTFPSQSYSFTSCVTTEPSEISEPKKTVEFSNEDKQFSWSPTKFPNFLDPSHNFVTSTLPTLAGDLALTTLNDQKVEYKYPKEQRRSSGNCGDNQSVNFLSVSQLVDHTKSESTPASRTTARRNSGSRSKSTAKRNKSPKQDTATDKGNKMNNNFGQNDIFYEHKARNPIKNVSNNYSAEALIGNQDSEANNKKCDVAVNKSFGSSSFLTENIITYFPTVEENYANVASQNLQNVPSFTHNNFQNTTYSTSSFIYTASTIASSYLPNNFDTNIHDYSSENVNSDQSAAKDKVCNKNYRQGSTTKDEKQNVCVNNSKKVRKKQEITNPTNFSSFEYPFLTVPGSTNSPILPEDFHMHTSFLPPTATPYPCKTSLYQKQTNDFNPNTLLPLPGLPRTGVQHPEVSPSINSAGTSFTNFNLSTIFPEINKGTTTNVYQDSNIKETSNAGSLQVPFSAEPKYTFSS